MVGVQLVLALLANETGSQFEVSDLSLCKGFNGANLKLSTNASQLGWMMASLKYCHE